jgi:hypothetical protein
VAPLITDQFVAAGFPAASFGPLDPAQAAIAKNADRQVLGCMNDLAFACQHAAADAGSLTRLDPQALHERLQGNITSATNYPYLPPLDLLADKIQQPRRFGRGHLSSRGRRSISRGRSPQAPPRR